MDKFKWDWLRVSEPVIRTRCSGNSREFGFSVSFVDRASLNLWLRGRLVSSICLKWEQLQNLAVIGYK